MLLTFWPLLLYLPTTMQEPLHMSLALVLAGLFYRLLAERSESKYTLIITLIVLVVAALLRASWGILFIPLLLTGRSSVTTAKLLAAGVLCLSISLSIFAFIAAPYPDNFVNSLRTITKTRPTDGWNFFYDHFCINLRRRFSGKDGEPLETALHYQLMTVLLLTPGICFLGPKKQLSRQGSQ